MIKFIIFFLVGFIIFLLMQEGNSYSKNKAINTLAKQSARWSTAASQDKNPMIAVLHANYGAGYLWAIGDIATSSEFENATGLNYEKFRDEVISVQEKATRNAIITCPQFGPNPTYLTSVAGEGV